MPGGPGAGKPGLLPVQLPHHCFRPANQVGRLAAEQLDRAVANRLRDLAESGFVCFDLVLELTEGGLDVLAMLRPVGARALEVFRMALEGSEGSLHRVVRPEIARTIEGLV
ncbi:hypothetical protein [Planctomycetes bacterium Poly30]|uniref:hypothetical protein n=1 Tax=Saltatorellus ferox TaxID=2528018 RepID=UPI0011A43495